MRTNTFVIGWLFVLFMVAFGCGVSAIIDRLEDIARAIRDEKERKPHA